MLAQRVRRWLLLTTAGLLVVAVTAALVVRPKLEAVVARRIVDAARARGFTAEVGAVHIGVWPPMRVERLSLRREGAVGVEVPALRLFLRPVGSGLVGRSSFDLPAGANITLAHGFSLHVSPTSWRLESPGESGLVVRRSGDGAGLWLSRIGDVLRVDLRDDAVGTWLEVRHEGRPLVEAGRCLGHVEVRGGPAEGSVDLDLASDGARLVGLETIDGGDVPHAWGAPFAAHVRFAAGWHGGSGSVSVTAARLASDVADGEGTLNAEGIGDEQGIHGRLALDVRRLDFDRLFAVLGVTLPVETHGLGAAVLSLSVEGSLDAPDALHIEPRFAFSPPARLPDPILALRAPFRCNARLPDGTDRAIEVSPDSPDYVALADVPPLFVRTLLLGEDSGFYGHQGLDLGEIPMALATDLSRGGVARGASTLTQQLAKNLFLSRDKRVSRKLKELALALLLEATLSKERILEIYLNVIEWGPGVYGLRPASRYYFGKEPARLTTAEGAFLVAIVPGPIKYQRSIATGEMSERFRPLVESLLNKLVSVGAIDPTQHQAALSARLKFRNIPLPAAAAEETLEEPVSVEGGE